MGFRSLLVFGPDVGFFKRRAYKLLHSSLIISLSTSAELDYVFERRRKEHAPSEDEIGDVSLRASGVHGELGRRGGGDQVLAGRRAALRAGRRAGAEEGADAFRQTHQRNVGGEVQRDGARSREGTGVNGD